MADEVEETCRICRVGAEAERPLRHPCACRGSIRFVHDDCLLRWLSTRPTSTSTSTSRCEVCKHEISICPIYAANAPARLPLSEFILALSFKLLGWLLLLLSLIFALSIWEFLMPLTTVWTWRLALSRSFSEVRQLLSLRLSTNSILADGLYGLRFMPSADTIFVCVSIRRAFLRDLVRFRDLNWLARMATDALAPFALWAERLEARLQERFGRLDNLQVLALHTVEAAFMVVMGDVVIACIFGFVPFSVGRLILCLISCFDSGNADKIHRPNISRSSILLIGYGFIFSLLIFLCWLISFHQYMRGERPTISVFFNALTRGVCWLFSPLRRLPRIDVMVHWDISFSQQLFRGLKNLMTVVNISINLIIGIGICPLFSGWLLDICTSKLFGATVYQKLEHIFVSSFASTTLHWLVGCIYMSLRIKFSSLLRKVLRNGVKIPFIHIARGRNPRQIINMPFYKFIFRILCNLFLGVIYVVMVILVPVQIVTQVVPVMFPLDIVTFHPPTQGITFLQALQNYVELLSGVILLKVLIGNTLKYLGPRELAEKLLQYWFAVTGQALGLSDFLLARPGAFGQPEIENTGAAKDQHGSIAEVQQKRKFVVLRIALLVVLAWLTVVLFNSAVLMAPILVGHALLGAIPRLPIARGLKSNDLFAFAVGFCIISNTMAASRDSFAYMTTGRRCLLVSDICKWGAAASKSFPLLFIWIVIIPLLIGLLVDLLVIAPFLGSVSEVAVFDMYCTWFVGLLLLKFWTKLAHWTRVVPFLACFVDESWHVKLTRAREEGFLRLRAVWILQEILIPITMKLLTALCVPYVLAKCIFPSFGYSAAVNSTVYCFAWLGCLVLHMLCYLTKRFCRVLMKFHDSLRDERYLIGRRLQNYAADL